MLAIGAVHTFILMRFCDICFEDYRINRKLIRIAFVILWVCENFIRFSLPAKYLTQSAVLFAIEIIFLFGISIFYKGKPFYCIIISFLIPFLYCSTEWMIMRALFGNVKLTINGKYFISAGSSCILLFMLELLLGRVKKSKQKYERELLEQEIRMYEHQFDVIHQSQNDINSLKHDMKHHIKMLSDLVVNGEKEAILKYLSDMGDFMDSGKTYVTSGNERIDSILNYMIGKAEMAKINVDWKILIPENLDISTFDINVILSNLLDNALNALHEVPQPLLHILIKYDRGILCINIQNNYIQKQTLNRKENSIVGSISGHGYGLKNVRRVAEKYHGNLEIIHTDENFTANVLLFVSSTTCNK